MDVSTLMKIVLSSNSVGALSQNTGLSEDKVANVVQSIMPMLLQGASAQANGKDTAAGFAKAIEDHSESDTRDLAKFLGGVDLVDGAKIVAHLLGADSSASVLSASKKSGVSEVDVKKILTLVAPLLLAILGQQKKKHGLTSILLQTVMTGAAAKMSDGAGKEVMSLLGKLIK